MEGREMRYLGSGVLLTLLLQACVAVEGPAPVASSPVPDRIPARQAVANFEAVVASVEPVAERVCRERVRDRNCDFEIVIDARAGQPPNAFQTLDDRGRPVIGFTVALIAEARNRDELAFILGHEAAHHIAGHIPQTQRRALEGALIGTVLASLGGLDAQGVDTAQRIGAGIGARRYAKDFELQADRLGTIIAARAGFDPVRGAAFFARIPDPGDRFLGTHPPNADRIETVRRTAAGL
jgi:predicted Zn-dependent protease